MESCEKSDVAAAVTGEVWLDLVIVGTVDASVAQSAGTNQPFNVAASFLDPPRPLRLLPLPPSTHICQSSVNTSDPTDILFSFYSFNALCKGQSQSTI